MLQILEKKIPQEFNYEIIYKKNNTPDGEWLHLNEWQNEFMSDTDYYINIGNSPCSLSYQYPKEYIKFHKNRDGAIQINICVITNDYTYEWHKSHEDGSENFLITRLKNDKFLITFRTIHDGIYTSTINLTGDNMSRINVITSDLIETQNTFGKRPLAEYYQCFTEEIERMYNNGYLKKLLPTIINLKNIKIIESMFKTPIMNLISSLDYNERMRRYNKIEFDLFEERKDRLEEARKNFAIHRKYYESQVDLINKTYNDKVRILAKYNLTDKKN